VRQRAEGEIEARLFPVDAVDRGQRRQIVGRELWKHVAHGVTGAPVGGQKRNLDARMAQQQPHQFSAGISRSTEYRDLGFFGHNVILPLLACSRIRGRISGVRL
jgi:hypothetical protein